MNYRSKSYEAAQRAKAMMKLYKEHMGIKEDDITPAASAVKDMDMKYPGGGENSRIRDGEGKKVTPPCLPLS